MPLIFACGRSDALDEGVELAGPVDVVGVVAAPAEEAAILLAADRGSDAFECHGRLSRYAWRRLIRPRRPFAVHQRPRGGDRLDDVVVAGAAAEIAFQALADLLLGQALRMRVHQVDRAHHHARRAEAALQRVMLAEHLLHRVQRAVGRGEALDRGDAAAVGLQRQHGAGLHRDAVDMHDAGAALAGVAADMGAGQPQLLAQQFDQQGAAFDLHRVLLAVYRQGDLRHARAPFHSRFVATVQAAGVLCPGGQWGGVWSRRWEMVKREGRRLPPLCRCGRSRRP